MLKTLAVPGVALFAALLIVLGVQLVRALDNFRDSRHAASFGGHSGFGRKASRLSFVVILSLATIASACGLVFCALSIL